MKTDKTRKTSLEKQLRKNNLNLTNLKKALLRAALAPFMFQLSKHSN